ncbi:2-oxo-4-hydroxy-4-carboxy-5-ureidoimidazoline decarboxylase [Neptunomonas antarctica]|uniref:2-oxo-4-hydroxy-4-carboxy-5-ureidoimidazoline decarboxylase n=1 Tax=Neptunomonas antarctica TaxID=619304 RepID=A0A1N7L9P2_9GAMM|nr:2-oxo-4-hydroxy-4-carboxy-5-ureidoimidazoline decarboxylase [Neptunomonas antarctica]SIS70503.1 OHCU decarboxylase [Neptunomonas antarctica]
MSKVCFQHCTPSEMDRDTFVSTFGDIYEHSPWIAEQAYDQGIDSSHNEIAVLQKKMASILLNADKQAQLDLINAHPDLAGKAAVSGELTEASTSEQAGAGISDCTAIEFARFTELNDAFKTKFGFPFIMAVKGSNRHLILASFEERIHHAPEQEFVRALQEINKISQFRLAIL